ncbi:MAG: flagellar basal body P-ring formation chaperone FlgA, partial [Gammaproteobacteria bacterium]|nr:flagellar basal body P-ring formation chaperone FlgA [Gammaproteobacteria bacterium]
GVLSRGHVVRAQDLYISNQDLNAKGRSYYSQVDDIIGMIVKTPVRSGTILRKRHLRLPTIIKRGQKVTIIAGRKQFEIRMTGQALMDGSKGDLIRVTNISSKKTVEGEVIRAGVIRIQL